MIPKRKGHLGANLTDSHEKLPKITSVAYARNVFILTGSISKDCFKLMGSPLLAHGPSATLVDGM